MKNRSIGIIGGMGPYASSYFYELLLKKSNDIYGAKNNNDYPEIIIDSVPVPDFISDTKQQEEAMKMLISRVKKLSDFGCASIAMVCNTAHVLYPELIRYSKKEFVSMIELVTKEVQMRKLKKVGILATPTTIKSNLYKKALLKVRVEAIYPTL